MNRQAKHLEARAAVAEQLRQMGLRVEVAGRNSWYDLLVEGRVRVALRVAYPGRYTHRVRASGKQYVYDYDTWNFNFHRHGRWDRGYCDVFVCLARQRGGGDEAFVIPATEVSGPTFSLHGASQAYRGKYAAFRNRWSVIINAMSPDENAVNVA